MQSDRTLKHFISAIILLYQNIKYGCSNESLQHNHYVFNNDIASGSLNNVHLLFENMFSEFFIAMWNDLRS